MKTENLLTGTVGIALTSLVNTAEINQIATAVVQIIIGIITILQLLKTPKNGDKTTKNRN